MERRSVDIYSIGQTPGSLVRAFWISQFVLCAKNVESILLQKYSNHTIDIDTWFYIQTFGIIPFFILFVRALTLTPITSEESNNLRAPKMSMQQWNGYSELDNESFDRRRKSTDILALSEQRYGKTPEENANLLSILTFWWLTSLFKIGYQRPLEMEDLNFLKGIDHADPSARLFYKSWNKELKKAQQKNIAHSAAESGDRDSGVNSVNSVRVKVEDGKEALLRPQCDEHAAPCCTVDEDAKYHPSLLKALLNAFGGPFFVAAPLKLLYGMKPRKPRKALFD